jgi:hypothetical protein
MRIFPQFSYSAGCPFSCHPECRQGFLHLHALKRDTGAQGMEQVLAAQHPDQ